MDSINLLGVNITATNYKDLLHILIKSPSSGYATLNSVHGIIEAQKSKLVQNCINESTYALCDGRPLFWILKKKSNQTIDHITGRVLMLEICRQAELNGLSIGIYGGTQISQASCIQVLKKQFPSLKIDFTYVPDFLLFNQKEKKEVLEKINISKINFLFVCLGCPKQEVWMKNHTNELNCFLLGVGAALDYISGAIKSPPQIITRMGFEWLFRLLSEPKRLFKRYFFIVPAFIYLMIKEKIKKKI